MDNAQGQEKAIKVIKADKRIRTLIILAYIVAVLVMIVLLVWILPLGNGKLEQIEPKVMSQIIQIVIAFIFLSIVPFGLYLCRFGWRVIEHEQMPPPGAKVIVDTRVLEGNKAVIRGKIIIAISLVLVIVGLYGGLYFPYKLGKIFSEKINLSAPKATSQN